MVDNQAYCLKVKEMDDEEYEAAVSLLNSANLHNILYDFHYKKILANRA